MAELTRDKIIQVFRDVAEQNPRAFKMCHMDENQHPEAYDYAILALRKLTKLDSRFGLNGKRGSATDISSDACAYIDDVEGLKIFDFLIGAGEHGTDLNRITLTDETEKSTVNGKVMGRWLDPFKFKTFAEKQGGGNKPEPVEPPKPPVPTFPHIPDSEFTELADELERIYMSKLNRPARTTFVDRLGTTRWATDYLTARSRGKNHTEALQIVRDEISKVVGKPVD